MKQMIVLGVIGIAAACSPAADGPANDRPQIAASQTGAGTDTPVPAPPAPAPANTPTPAPTLAGSAVLNTDQTRPPQPAAAATLVAQSDNSADPARSATRDCYLRVDGRVLVSGRCRVFPMGRDQYTLNTWDGGKPAQPHFAVVTKNSDTDTTATATWNADPADDRAMDPLGTVARDGDCWVNKRARICVR